MIRYIPGVEGTLSGYLSADPELKTLPRDGRFVCEFKICLNGLTVLDKNRNELKDDKGYSIRPSQWFKVSVFDEMAERTAQLLSKNSFVVIEGQQVHRAWPDEKDPAVLHDDYQWRPNSIKYLVNGDLVEIEPEIKVSELVAEAEAVSRSKK